MLLGNEVRFMKYAADNVTVREGCEEAGELCLCNTNFVVHHQAWKISIVHIDVCPANTQVLGSDISPWKLRSDTRSFNAVLKSLFL